MSCDKLKFPLSLLYFNNLKFSFHIVHIMNHDLRVKCLQNYLIFHYE